MAQPTEAAIAMLRKNPHTADQFDEMFGKGASAQYVKDETPGILSKVGAVASDIGTGITEAPGAIARGAVNAVNETSNTLKDAGDYLNEHVMDLGQITLDKHGVGWKPGTPQQNAVQVPKAITPREPESVTGHLIEGVSQFTAGMVGAGKFLGAFGVGAGATTATKFASMAAKGAIADATVFDPHAERLSNLIEANPSLSNPVTSFLAAKPGDSGAEGRLKNAVEGFLTGTALEGFVHGVKAIKLARSGDLKGAAEAADASGASHAAGVAHEKSVTDATATDTTAPHTAPDVPAPTARPTDAPELAPNTASMVDGVEAKVAGDEAPKPAEAPRDVMRVATPPGGEPKFRLDDAEIASYRDNLAARFSLDGVNTGLDKGTTSAHFNFDKWNTDEDIKAAANAMAGVVDSHLNAVRGGNEDGVRSWDEVRKNADTIAEITGGDPRIMLQHLTTLAGNVKHLDSMTKAYGDMLVTMTAHSDKLAQMLTDGVPGQYGSMERLKAAYAHSTNLLGNTYAMVKGVQTNIARAQNASKIFRDINPAVKQGLENIDPEDDLLLMTIAKRQAASSRGVNDPLAAAASTRKLLEGSVLNKALAVHNEYWFNSVLSGVKTHVVNVTGNTVKAVFMPAERMVAGLLSDNHPQYLEGAYQYVGIMKSLKDSLMMASKAFNVADNILDGQRGAYEGVNRQAITASMFGQEEGDAIAPIINGIGDIVRLPSRLLMAEDEFFKQVNYRSRTYAQAMREGVEQGLDAKGVATLVEKRMAQAFDPKGGANLVDTDGVPVATRLAALQQAREGTYTQPLEHGMGRWLEQGAQAHPFVRVIMPFIRVPTNLMRDLWQHTPLLGLVQKNLKEDIEAGGERASMAYAKQATGTAIWSVAIGAALEGGITGNGPTDPQMRKAWLLQNQPYSFVHTDAETGKKTFTQYSRLDPLFTPFGLAADFANIAGQLPNEDVDTFARAATLAMVNNLASKTYLQGLIQAVGVLQDDREAKLQSFIEQRAASYVPNILGAANPDPHLHEVRSVLEAMQAKVPGFSSRLPPRRDVLGEVMNVPMGYPFDAINPFTVRTVNPDPVRDEMARLASSDAGIRFPMPSTKMDVLDLTTVQGPDGVSFYDKWMQNIGEASIGGQSLHDKLTNTVSAAMYQNAADGNAVYKKSRKVDLIQGDLDRYRQYALRETLKEYPELQQALRSYKSGAKRVRTGQEPGSDPFAVFN